MTRDKPTRGKAGRIFARHLGLIVMLGGLAACGSPSDSNDAGAAADPAAALTASDISENNRGVALMGSFDYPGARDVFAELVARRPGWHDARLNLAIATLNRQQEGDEATALALASQVLEQAPDHLRAHYVSGLLQLYLGESGQAGAHFQRVLEADPTDGYAAYYLAQCHTQTGDLDNALALYQKAMTLDPYLRSAYYGAAQVLRRMGRQGEAGEMLAAYQRFADNPRARLAEFKYTRMGSRAEVKTVDLDAPARPTLDGPLFGATRRVDIASSLTGGPALTTADLDADGIQDLFVGSAGRSRVLRGDGEGGFADISHPLTATTAVRGALWGDLDNDGLLDVYLCRDGVDELWRQTGRGVWESVAAESGLAAEAHDCATGSLFDADHDGDLDIMVARHDGPVVLLNNNLDGTFRPLDEPFATTDGGRQILPVDLDNDRDLDIVVLYESPPHAVHINDRLWRYTDSDAFAGLVNTPMNAIVSADVDADGQSELYSADASGALAEWRPGTDGIWRARVLSPEAGSGGPVTTLSAGDLSGDGVPELLVVDAAGWHVVALPGGEIMFRSDRRLATGTSLVRDAAAGPDFIGVAMNDGALLQWPAGAGRYPFMGLRLSGKEERADSMRTNRSAIGTRIAVRTGSRWSVAAQLDNDSGPGQNLQPISVGLGAAPRADYIALYWPDGVFQTELNLDGAQMHDVAETQRQLSSCPVLFAWDGNEYRFVSDILGVGGVGFMAAPGRYVTPRPWENFLFPEHAVAPRLGRYEIKITEPMEEIAAIDFAALHVHELPPGWSMVVDERMGTGAPEVTGAALYYRTEMMPASAIAASGLDVTASLAMADRVAAPPGEPDRRFIGRLAAPQSVTLTFRQPLDATPGRPVLVADGWVEYPYSQTVFAAWQAGAFYEPPTLEAAAGDGVFQTVHAAFGYPAGMPRRMALPLDALPAGTTRLRLTTSLQLFWDRISIVYAEPPPPSMRVISAPPLEARLAFIGFPRRDNGPQMQPGYDYSDRAADWDTRYPAGYYSEYGNVMPLLERLDEALVILGPGEELHLEFNAPARPRQSGWTRRLVLETHGYAKDMDLYTEHSGTVGPLPRRAGTDPLIRDRLHQRFNTRFEAGR